MKILSLLLLVISPLSLLAQNTFEQYNLEELDSIYKQVKVPKTKLLCAFTMLEKAAKKFDLQDTSYAKILFKVGSAYLNVNLDSSIVYTTKAIKIQKLKTPRHADYAKSLNNLGIAHYYKGETKETEKYWLQAADIRQEVFGETHISYLGSLVNLGNLFMDLGNYQGAIDNYSKAKLLFEKNSLTTHKYYLICLTNLAIVHEKLTDYETAERFYLQTISVQKETLGEEHPTYLISLGNLASMYSTVEDYERAESFLLRVLALKKKVLGEEHYSCGQTLNSLGNLYSVLQYYKKAERFYLEDLKITKKVKGEKSSSVAISLGNMGLLYRKMKAYEKSERFLLHSLEIKKELLGEQHPNYASGLRHLGNLYTDLGQFNKSEALFLQVYNIYKEISSPKSTVAILSLTNLASVYNDKNAFELAWEYLLLSIHANTDLVLSKNITPNWIDQFSKANHVSLDHSITCLHIIYKLLPKQGNPNFKQQQVWIADLALKFLRKKKNRFSADQDKLRILSESAQWVLRAMQVLDKNKEAAKGLSIAEQNKSVLLLDAAGNKRAYRLGTLPDSIIQQEKKLEKAYINIKAALVKNNSETEQDKIQEAFIELNFKIDSFQESIKKNYPKHAATKYQHAPIQVDEIQALLDKKTAMLEYLIGDSIVYIFYIDQKEVKRYDFLVDNALLKNKIHLLHKVLSNYNFLKNNKLAYRQYVNQANWFYQNLVAPALANTQKIKQLVIITDGELGHLPFETFLTKPAPQQVTNYNELHYLIQDYSISYNYSATLWKDNQHIKKGRNNGQILGLAANYKKGPDSSNLRLRVPSDLRVRSVLEPLAAARQEVESLSENFNGFFAFDSLASERIFKEKAADFSIIHLAMHGILNQREPILSSLAFTEDNDPLENNFLHAYEISKMELNADLVVLSACETGFGRFEQGNGIASLARAFTYAGAPAMIVSLWQVNDYTTSALMKSLYNNLANGMRKDEALRQAKISYLNNVEGIVGHPAFWSPFILIGNESPTSISQKGTFTPWVIGGGILFFVLIGTAFLRRKK